VRAIHLNKEPAMRVKTNVKAGPIEIKELVIRVGVSPQGG